MLMRIAVSGSHSLGKSTLVDDWVARHPQFIREEEPYRALGLHGPYQILFRDESTRLHNGIQLYYSLSRVHRYAAQSDEVIFDRAPVDYLAYSQYTADAGSTDIDDAFVTSMTPAVIESLDRLDIIAFVPKSDEWPVEMEADGIRPTDHAYRDAVDAVFKQIYREGRYGVMTGDRHPLVVELVGSREDRVDQLARAVNEVRGRDRRLLEERR
jgi:hypothetical protein